jgi:hypothetical protein
LSAIPLSVVLPTPPASTLPLCRSSSSPPLRLPSKRPHPSPIPRHVPLRCSPLPLGSHPPEDRHPFGRRAWRSASISTLHTHTPHPSILHPRCASDWAFARRVHSLGTALTPLSVLRIHLHPYPGSHRLLLQAAQGSQARLGASRWSEGQVL